MVNQFIADSITSLDLDSIPTSDLLMVAEDSPFKNAIRNTNFFEKPEPGQVKSAPAANHEEVLLILVIFCMRSSFTMFSILWWKSFVVGSFSFF